MLVNLNARLTLILHVKIVVYISKLNVIIIKVPKQL